MHILYKQSQNSRHNSVADMFIYSLPERKMAIDQAIADAKEHFKRREEVNVKARAEKSRKPTSTQLLARLFKRPSEKALKLGKAQLLYEDMVRRAEKKLSEIKRKSHAQAQSAEARAEELASGLFHKPGSVLSSDEIARMWTESDCSILREVPDCNFPTVNQFRTIDGTCNNLENPLFGASGTPLTRVTPAYYEDGMSSLRGGLQARGRNFFNVGPFTKPNPSARVVSESIVRDISKFETPFTHMLMQWGQFLDHDLDLSPELEADCESCIFTEICEPINVPNSDEAFGIGTPQNGDCLLLRRSLPTCDSSLPGQFLPRQQINDLTSYIDASQVYGSNAIVETSVRKFRGGLLRTGPAFPGTKPTLPVDTENIAACPNQIGCFLAGDVRANEQISLTIMHTLWLREHNRIAKQLGHLNPHWDDERIFQEARRIVGAQNAKITYEDFLPKVLGPKVFRKVIGPYRGYDPRVDAGVPNSFAAAAYRFGHSLIRPFFDRFGPGYGSFAGGPLPLVEAFFNPEQFRLSNGTDPIVRGLVSVNPRKVDEFLNSVLTTQLFETDNSPGMDLASLNIQRGRDHGLAPYPIWRNFCKRAFNITSDFENDLTLVRFLQTYGSLDTIDLWVGGLAEDRLPDSLLGATFACLFGITFANLRNGDRFYYENPGVFSRAQLKQIRRASLSRVICDNSDGIESIQKDAFLSTSVDPRVTCSRIPGINLNTFREDICYYRVRVRPHNFDLPLRTFSRSARNAFSFFHSTARASSQDVFECLPTECPTDRAPDDVIAYSSVELLDVLEITPNSALPSSSLNPPHSGAYRAKWPRSQFGSGGVFFSLEACQRASSSALTYSLPSTQSAKVEALVLSHAMQDSKSDNPESPETDEDVPIDILDILKHDDNPNAEVLSIPTKGKGVVKEQSDEELLNDLEEALELRALK